jgi:3-isopropylmalate dehydratase small subunit
VGGKNFGSGSSEHAAWQFTITDFELLFCLSFADIFKEIA